MRNERLLNDTVPPLPPLCPFLAGTLVGLLTWSWLSSAAWSSADDPFLAPIRIEYWEAGEQLVVLGSHGRRLVLVRPGQNEVARVIPLPGPGGDLIVRENTAYVAVCQPAGIVLLVDLATGKTLDRFHVGHSPTALALSQDGQLLCVANRFDNSIDLVDLENGEKRSVKVLREPVALALDEKSRRLFVANHLPVVRPFLDDENPVIAAEVSVIDVQHPTVVKHIELPNGSQSLRAMAMSPDGRSVLVTHVLGNYVVPTMRIEHGAMNQNVLSVIGTEPLQWEGTVSLDDPEQGAANPWAVAFLDDGARLLVTHTGTHELSVIDFAAFRDRLREFAGSGSLSGPAGLQMMHGIRQRIPARVTGPRSMLIQDRTVYLAGYFSDNLAALSLDDPGPTPRVVALDRLRRAPQWRLGEQYFNDASLCYQKWQSCATCHPDGRSDVLYWDLLNDGVGNTKNTKSLLMSALTPPVMWRGVRADAAMAVRTGIHHIQFATPDPEQADAIEQYLLHMPAVPSPYLNHDVLESPKTEEASCAKCHFPGVPRGTLTAAAQRGKAIFEGKAGCVTCHPHPYFTVQKSVDPGLGSGVLYDVPSLIEVWRTAPYLHSGDALDLKETITDFNYQHRRGATHTLGSQELDDLIEYLKSL